MPSIPIAGISTQYIYIIFFQDRGNGLSMILRQIRYVHWSGTGAIGGAMVRCDGAIGGAIGGAMVRCDGTIGGAMVRCDGALGGAMVQCDGAIGGAICGLIM